MRAVAETLARMGPAPLFGRPLVMSSSVSGDQVEATMEGLVDRPMRDVREALADAQHWCAVLVLHINNKACKVDVAGAGATILELKVARKYDQPVEGAYPMRFEYRVLQAGDDQLSVRLHAASGPVGTTDYEIRLEAVPVDAGRTAIRLMNAYRQGTFTGMAMGLYFGTVGRGKVGFTREPATAAGQPIGGVRGLLERNLMRYFLAVEAAAATPSPLTEEQYLRRLKDWFRASQRYPSQLHEVELDTYLALKRPLLDMGVVQAPPLPRP